MGPQWAVATGLDRFGYGDEQAMVTEQRGCEGLMQLIFLTSGFRTW